MNCASLSLLEITMNSDSQLESKSAKNVLLINNVSFYYFTFSGYEVIRGHLPDFQMKVRMEAFGI